MIPSFFSLLFTLLPLQVVPIDIGINSGGEFAFDWDGNHSDGSPMAETESVEFHYMPDPPIEPGTGTGDGHVTVSLPLAAVIGKNVITMRDSLAGVPGGIYKLNIRLIGIAGNPSTYSTPIGPLRVRVKNPSAPTALHVVGE
jgi:hypothetical protein